MRAYILSWTYALVYAYESVSPSAPPTTRPPLTSQSPTPPHFHHPTFPRATLSRPDSPSHVLHFAVATTNLPRPPNRPGDPSSLHSSLPAWIQNESITIFSYAIDLLALLRVLVPRPRCASPSPCSPRSIHPLPHSILIFPIFALHILTLHKPYSPPTYTPQPCSPLPLRYRLSFIRSFVFPHQFDLLSSQSIQQQWRRRRRRRSLHSISFSFLPFIFLSLSLSPPSLSLFCLSL